MNLCHAFGPVTYGGYKITGFCIIDLVQPCLEDTNLHELVSYLWASHMWSINNYKSLDHRFGPAGFGGYKIT